MAECESRTSAFEGSKYAESWIEVYHSRISWTSALISYKKDSEDWVPFGKCKVRNYNYIYIYGLMLTLYFIQLLDASDIRPGFRAFRTRANRLEFLVRDGGHGTGGGGIDSRKAAGDSAVPHVVTVPGRYVLSSDEKWLRRVGDADVIECLRKMRPDDKYVEVQYCASASAVSERVRWRKVYIVRVAGGKKYSTSAAMRSMGAGTDTWAYRCAFRGDRGENGNGNSCMEFAFTDGHGEWDDGNYRVFLPGKYCIDVKNKTLIYFGPSHADLHLNK